MIEVGKEVKLYRCSCQSGLEGCFMDEIFIYIRTVQKQRDTRKLG